MPRRARELPEGQALCVDAISHLGGVGSASTLHQHFRGKPEIDPAAGRSRLVQTHRG